MRVIVVGAGPGGLNCAYHLQQAGADVMVLEKNEVVGPKVCAGGLTAKSIKYVPAELIERRFKNIYFQLNNGKHKMNFGSDFLWTFSRRKFGMWQLGRLKRNTVKTGARVTDISKNHVVASCKKYMFTHLVGADGSASVVRKHLGLDFSTTLAMQYRIPTGTGDITVALDRKFMNWYLWMFPHEGYTSVGTGADITKISPETLKKNFHSWLDEHDIGYDNLKLEMFPINHCYLGHRFGNIYLTGDAAGLASSFTGEGIYQALASGEDTARLILDVNFIPHKINSIVRKKALHDMALSFVGSQAVQRIFSLGIKSRSFSHLAYRFACG